MMTDVAVTPNQDQPTVSQLLT